MSDNVRRRALEAMLRHVRVKPDGNVTAAEMEAFVKLHQTYGGSLSGSTDGNVSRVAANLDRRRRTATERLLRSVAANDLDGVLQAIRGGFADVEAVDADGITALDRAAIKGNAEMIRALVRAGADPHGDERAPLYGWPTPMLRRIERSLSTSNLTSLQNVSRRMTDRIPSEYNKCISRVVRAFRKIELWGKRCQSRTVTNIGKDAERMAHIKALWTKMNEPYLKFTVDKLRDNLDNMELEVSFDPYPYYLNLGIRLSHPYVGDEDGKKYRETLQILGLWFGFKDNDGVRHYDMLLTNLNSTFTFKTFKQFFSTKRPQFIPSISRIRKITPSYDNQLRPRMDKQTASKLVYLLDRALRAVPKSRNGILVYTTHNERLRIRDNMIHYVFECMGPRDGWELVCRVMS
jgi:hypothetical protein